MHDQGSEIVTMGSGVFIGMALALIAVSVALLVALRRIAVLRKQLAPVWPPVSDARSPLETMTEARRAALVPKAQPIWGTERLRQRRAALRPRPEPSIDVTTMPYWQARHHSHLETEVDRIGSHAMSTPAD